MKLIIIYIVISTVGFSQKCDSKNWKIYYDSDGHNMKDCELSGADLSGENLSEANLEGANLSGANLSGANLKQTDLISTNLASADLSGANLLLSYSKNAIISDIKTSSTTKSDACFDNELLDRILCTAIRKLESDSPPFYGEMRNYHRDDLF